MLESAEDLLLVSSDRAFERNSTRFWINAREARRLARLLSSALSVLSFFTRQVASVVSGADLIFNSAHGEQVRVVFWVKIVRNTSLAGRFSSFFVAFFASCAPMGAERAKTRPTNAKTFVMVILLKCELTANFRGSCNYVFANCIISNACCK